MQFTSHSHLLHILCVGNTIMKLSYLWSGIRRIALEENCPLVRVRVWAISKIYFCKAFALYLAFIFSILSVCLCNLPLFPQIFLTWSQNNVLWTVCAEEVRIALCFYMITFIFKVVILIFFCVGRIGVKENVQ